VKKVYLIIQARMGSTRLPGKVMMDICGKPLLAWIIERMKETVLTDRIIVATTKKDQDEVIIDLAKRYDVDVFRGDEKDVLGRFYEAASFFMKKDKIEEDNLVIVRVCADNPLVDPWEVDRIIGFFLKSGYEYVFNHIPAFDNGYPNGLGVEVFGFKILKELWFKAKEESHREHVTKYIWDNPNSFSIGILKAPPSIYEPSLELDVDTQKDLDWIKKVYSRLIELYGNKCFNAVEIIDAARFLSKNFLSIDGVLKY